MRSTMDWLRDALCQLMLVNEDDITPGTTLDDLDCQSLDRIELTMMAEEEFEIDLSDLDVANHFTASSTIQEMVDFIDKKWRMVQ